MPPVPAPESTLPQVSRLQAFLGGQPQQQPPSPRPQQAPQPPPPRLPTSSGAPQVISFGLIIVTCVTVQIKVTDLL